MIDHGLKLCEDGTLQITLPKGTMVRRVLVDEEGSHFCEAMYPKTGSGISKEPTYEQVMEYCNKRCLTLVSEEFLAKLPSAQQCMTATSNTMVSDTVKIPIMDGTTERLPSAQPERKKGKWICQTDDDIWNCSECDFEIDGTGCIDSLEYLKIYNFCPNCGADMRGEQDEAD